MGSFLSRRRYLLFWQLLLLIAGTTWLLAPHLNSHLSYRISLISQYETSGQPYSLLFRAGDMLAGVLVLLLGLAVAKDKSRKYFGWILLVIGGGMILDPALPTTCRVVGNYCQEYFSFYFLLHAIETVITSLAFFGVAIYDAAKRRKLVSIAFTAFQIAYGLLFASQFANQEHFNTVTQYAYQSSLIVWLAWFGRDILAERNFKPSATEAAIVKRLAAAWAFVNGILAILISLAHIHLLGRIKGFYFAGDSAWLAQHGVIVGIVMLYLSRHLWRGERRARQIFAGIVAIETLKYALISPNPALMILYLLTFCSFFILRDNFDRGVVPLTWQMRLRDLYFMVAALLVAAVAALISLDRDSRVAAITGRTFDNFFDYLTPAQLVGVHPLRSALLAHTISVFIATSLAIVLWILFRPYKITRGSRNYRKVTSYLVRNSRASEDYFKLWPADKDYFMPPRLNGFVAYKIVGPVAFALANPIGADAKKLIPAYLNWAKDQRLKTCFLPIYEQDKKLYHEAGLELLQIGSSAVIPIKSFISETVNDKWWRWQKNRAAKSGYEFAVSQPPHSATFLRQLRKVSDAWLTKDGRVERGFAMGYFDETYLQKCVVYYLRDNEGQLLAFANQLPQFKPGRILSVDLMRHLPEVNNAMPFLLLSVITWIGQNYKNARYFDLGFVPFAGAKGPVLSIARTLGSGRFSARGLEQFKNKFNPEWQPNYLAYDGDIADLAVIALYIERAMELDN